MHIERVQPAEQLWQRVEPTANASFMQAILPEVVGKVYSKPQPSKVYETQDNVLSSLVSVPDCGNEVATPSGFLLNYPPPRSVAKPFDRSRTITNRHDYHVDST